jgi:hypothetical protein
MLSPDDVMEALWRHAEGDWGDVDEDDLISNEFVFEEETHLLSVYHAATGQEFWIITKYDYSVTTVLLPEDY